MMLVGRGLEGNKQSVVLLTEPYTVDNKITGMPKGTKAVFARSREPGAPRAGIVSSIDVNLTAMDSWCNRDCAVALARIAGTQTVLISLYLDIKKEIQPPWLDRLMEMIDQKKYPVIMGIDSNAHSTMYGPDNSVRGNAFEDFILQYGLKVENQGLAPIFEVKRGTKLVQTHIDVTLTRGLSVRLQNWRVNRDYNASDNNTICFEIETSKPELDLIRPWSKADWLLFKETLNGANYGVSVDMSMKKLDRLVDRIGIQDTGGCTRQGMSPDEDFPSGRQVQLGDEETRRRKSEGG